jgi:uracil-DNA glycosylase
MTRDADLDTLRDDAADCKACPLWAIGTQTVFGSGPASARLMLIGEAPGAQEDKAGTPFVGPAGRVFDQALDAAGLDRRTIYVTNTVKHRPWVDSNGRKKNRAPKRSEINACARWLDAELELVRPDVICCLGAVAAKRILGRDFRLMEQRGTWFESSTGARVLATIHPSFILLQSGETQERWRATLIEDLRMVNEQLTSLSV